MRNIINHNYTQRHTQDCTLPYERGAFKIENYFNIAVRQVFSFIFLFPFFLFYFFKEWLMIMAFQSKSKAAFPGK